ncbi:MAG: LysR family transcriptional regulator [Rhizobiaceae bacterium]
MLRFSLAQLEAFYWVARLGSFRSAAQHMRLSQPTITQRIKILEDAIETPLLDRSTYRPKLTSAGNVIFRHCQETLELANQIQSFRDSHGKNQSIVRLGAVDFTAMTDLPSILELFERDFSNIKLELTIDYSTRLQDLLVNNEIDIAVLSEPELLKGIQIIPLGSIPLSWAASPHSSISASKMDPKDLINMRIATNPPPSNLHDTIISWFAQADLVPEIISTCNSMHVLRQLVSSGYAISVLPTDILVSANGRDNLRALSIKPELKPHRAYLAYHQDNDDRALRAILSPISKLLTRH